MDFLLATSLPSRPCCDTWVDINPRIDELINRSYYCDVQRYADLLLVHNQRTYMTFYTLIAQTYTQHARATTLYARLHC